MSIQGCPDRPPASEEQAPLQESRFWWRVEDGLIVLAIGLLWPTVVLRWPGLFWRVVLYADVAVMTAVFVARLRRLVRVGPARRRAPSEGGR